MRDIAAEPTGEPGRATGTALDLLLDLLGDLRRAGIDYCYWKSGRRIAAALSGESDLDLLVAKADCDRTLPLLFARGFRLFASVPPHDDAGIMSFLGHDEPSGRIIHVHLHVRLGLGSSLLKMWRPPWESTVLAHAVAHVSMPIRVLDPATEAILALTRCCLEFDRLDVVALRQWRAMVAKFAADRAALAPLLNRATVRSRAAALMGEDLAEEASAAACSPAPPAKRLCRRLRARMAAYRDGSVGGNRLRLVLRSAVFLSRAANKRVIHAPRPWSRRAQAGGAVVAVLGVDGSGKSTLVRALRDWLGAEADVLPLYFGTGDGRPSLLLWPLKVMVPLVRKVLPRKPAGGSHGAVSDRPPGPLYGALITVWASVLAVEKRRKLKLARRAADRGMLVIADRFPQDQIAEFNDGPLLTRQRRVPAALRRFEARSYDLANRLAPDLVIKLRASPELIAQREPDMDAAVVRRRVEQVMQLDFPRSRVAVLDAGQSLEAVIAAAKREVWALL